MKLNEHEKYLYAMGYMSAIQEVFRGKDKNILRSINKIKRVLKERIVI